MHRHTLAALGQDPVSGPLPPAVVIKVIRQLSESILNLIMTVLGIQPGARYLGQTALPVPLSHPPCVWVILVGE
jgi:hypothetical protein